ncbi:hypothetical protein [Gemmata massiliana]|uniref:hypothetical protein n=1 Tax=Gemmata massiliana TaxID=1210884 RepID=UPI0013A6A613|nr:hypothetical protein [Gemmata massiliana]
MRGACDLTTVVLGDVALDIHGPATSRPADQRKRFERKVYEDELAVAVNEASRGRAAVPMSRRTMGRL